MYTFSVTVVLFINVLETLTSSLNGGKLPAQVNSHGPQIHEITWLSFGTNSLSQNLTRKSNVE